MINLGEEIKCKVSGFKGIVVAQTEYLNGCIRCGVQPKVKKDGTLPEVQWFDEPQLEVVGRKKISKGSPDTGGVTPYIPKNNVIPKRN